MPNDSVVESGIGMWHDKIQYFKSEIQPSQGGDEIQSEFFISLADFPTAFQELYEATALFKEFVKVTEIRPIKASQVPLSPAYKRETMGINFVWVNDFDTVMRGTEIVKVVLAKYNYRVHWGKYFGYLDRSYIE